MTSGQGAFIVLPSAREDLREASLFLGQRNPGRGVQFLNAAREEMVKLAKSPYLGSPRPQDDPLLHSIRRWPIAKFPQYGIFYRPFASGNGIEVFRVLHSSRDVSSHLQESLEA